MNNVDEEIFDIMNGLDCRDAIAEPYMDVFMGVLNNDEYLWNTHIIHHAYQQLARRLL